MDSYNYQVTKGVKTRFISSGDLFVSPEDIYDKFESYLSWCEEHPLKEAKLYGGEGEVAELDRMRMPTIQGFARYLVTSVASFTNWKNKYPDIFDFIEDSLHSVSIEGAAAGLLKEAIVTRKLQLADRQEITGVQRKIVILHTPDNGRAIPVREEQGLIEDADETE